MNTTIVDDLRRRAAGLDVPAVEHDAVCEPSLWRPAVALALATIGACVLVLLLTLWPMRVEIPPGRSEAFGAAVALVLRLEGGISQHASDPGGLTNYGISSRAHPGIDVRALTPDDVVALYYTHYWQPMQLDRFRPSVSSVLFDGSVHTGVRATVKRLQRVLGVTPDGIIGKRTLAATRAVRPAVLVTRLANARRAFYRRLDRRVFLKGWLRRIDAVEAHAHANVQ